MPEKPSSSSPTSSLAVQPNQTLNSSSERGLAPIKTAPESSLAGNFEKGPISNHSANYRPINSDVVDIYLQQAESYCNEKQWAKAIEACQEALHLDASSAQAYKVWGNVLQKQGMATDALGYYAKALILKPDFPEVYNNLGSLHARKQDWETAVSYYQKAIAKDNRFTEAYQNLAKVWKRLGETEKEVRCLATVLQIEPTAGTAQEHYRAAKALHAFGELDAAISLYKYAVKCDPSFKEAYQQLANVLEDKGDWQEAVACYHKVLALKERSSKTDTSIGAKASRNAFNTPTNQQVAQAVLEAVSQNKLPQLPSAEASEMSNSDSQKTTTVSLQQSPDSPETTEDLNPASSEPSDSSQITRNNADQQTILPEEKAKLVVAADARQGIFHWFKISTWFKCLKRIF